mmetsp:Transcript_9140/g.13813  ORF Transcript_9140/g.13813 Transcript_9140/m.13813 type:complete len:641 (-) Transcript_9140:47-1969(-)
MFLSKINNITQLQCNTTSAFAASSSASFSSSARVMFQPYKANTRDILFSLQEVLNAEETYKKLGYDCDSETIQMIVEESAKVSENVLNPLWESGDREGCKWSEEGVTTPSGFKEAYAEYAAGGWQGLSVPEKYGGQGLPSSLNLVKSETMATANWSFGMFPGLSMGAMNTLSLHASEEQKQLYLTRLASGEWSGTMCLTEAHCGTDLGQCKTKAEKIESGEHAGAYKINGTKIFISCGEHDLTPNIIHIVLARLPGAPEGTKGISLFIVPKHLVKDPESGELHPERNITCGGIENKMGIHASPTCIMNFDDSIGYMVGEPNRGLHYMFTFMNTARLGTGLQGQAASQQAYDASLPYALERCSLRSLEGAKYPDRPADPLIVHPDVRRMLLTQKAIAEGSRIMLYDCALIGDSWMSDALSAEEKAAQDDWLGLFTPIAKGFVTELSLEASSNAIQVWGGHGYIKDNGVEQIYRDARIGTLYEGTTGIQALDLLARKVLMNKGKLLNRFHAQITQLCSQLALDSNLGSLARQLLLKTFKWKYITARVGLKARSKSERDVINAACYDYLMFSGYVTLGYYWLRMANVAQKKLAEKPADAEFYKQKIDTAVFYFDKLLPRADSHATCVLSGKDSLMRIDDDKFM